MPPQHGSRDQLADICRFVPACLNLMQRRIAQCLPLLIFFFRTGLVPLRDARIDIPAQIIELLSIRLEVLDKAAYM
jgi:hypothetical protein